MSQIRMTFFNRRSLLVFPVVYFFQWHERQPRCQLLGWTGCSSCPPTSWWPWSFHHVVSLPHTSPQQTDHIAKIPFLLLLQPPIPSTPPSKPHAGMPENYKSTSKSLWKTDLNDNFLRTKHFEIHTQFFHKRHFPWTFWRLFLSP